jgi:pilus assembly protein Flp/PilA
MLNGRSSSLRARLRSRCRSFIDDSAGATAIEYALIAGLVGLAIVGLLSQIGTTLQTIFQNVANALAK